MIIDEERCRLCAQKSCYSEQPCRIDDRVICSQEWQTEKVEVAIKRDGEKQYIGLNAKQSQWFRDNDELCLCRDCTAVDLGFTLGTNTIAIRWLNLAEDESRELVACWLKYPELTIQSYPQRYTRTAARRYLYESGASDYKAEVIVSEQWLVPDYDGYWRATATE